MINNKIKVLQIAGGFNKGVSGGVASFLNSYYHHVDKEKFQFDFLALGYQCFEPYREEMENVGSSLHCLDAHEFKGIKGKINYTSKLKEFLKNTNYDIIHVNMGSLYTVLLCSRIAKKYGKGAKVISHSHNVLTYSKKAALVNRFSSKLFNLYGDYFFACSKDAANYMFSKKIVSSNKFQVLRNAINMDHFVFSETDREQYRKEFSIEDDELLIGHVGRFNKQKNHHFLIRVFNEVVKKNNKAKLVLVGTGNLENEIKDIATEFGITDKVQFLGQRKDVNKLMSAMDVFLFPSLFEGLGIVAIEAQASGLHVFASNTIPNEADVTALYHSLSLEMSAEVWAEAIVSQTYSKRISPLDKLDDAGYNVRKEVKELEGVYSRLLENN